MISQLLLQATGSFGLPELTAADSRTVYIAIGIVVGFIVLLVLGNMISNNKRIRMGGFPLKRGTGSSSSVVKSSAPKISKGKFRKIAKQIGLSPAQIKILEDIAEKHNVGSPAIFLTSHKTFNLTMKKVIQEYDNGAYSLEVKENYKMLLFNIKQKLDKSSVAGEKISTSRQLAVGKQIIITTSTGEKYSTSIVTNLADYMCANIPKRSDGSMLRLNKWEPIKISVPEKGDRGIFYDSKIAGYSTAKGISCIMLQHSNSIQSSKQRNFPRKELGKACYFFKINIVTLVDGKTTVKKAVIDDNAKGRLGSVLEISAGGCSIKSQNCLNRGDLLRVDIDIERRQTISALGKIVNIRKVTPGTATMHIQFTRMSKKNMNSINSYIYGIGERTTILDY
ncbi:MAG: PilZ domain-containing protein [Spirochaetaceae bacterium]|nr:PilZ domain-containing protein [Spirochaetaceae bacterium]